MSSKVQRIIDEDKLFSTEGARGVSNLCKLVRQLGYEDPFSNGHLTNGGTLGDLMCFLEDNPGAIESVVEWIKNNHDEEEEDIDDDDDEEEENDEE